MNLDDIENYIDCPTCTREVNVNLVNHRCHKCFHSKFPRKVLNPDKILCNLCGNSLCSEEFYNSHQPYGLHDVKVMGDYESIHLLDLNEYEFNLCEKCLRELFIQFKIKPKITYGTLNGNTEHVTWEEDQSIYEYSQWTREGGKHQAYLDGKCNAVKNCPQKALYTTFISGEFTENSSCEEHKNLRQYYSSTLTRFISNKLKPFL